MICKWLFSDHARQSREIKSGGREIKSGGIEKFLDKLDEFVEETKVTKQKYISEILSRELGQWMQQKAEQDKNLDIKHTDGQKVWDKPEVMEAIDDFMLRTGKIPKQTEFKNENGLPSYGAAGRALEMSPAEYMRERYDALGIETKQEKIEMTM